MNWSGIILGAAAFLSIGVFHPIVIKAEYYFTERCWPVFLAAGLFLLGVSTVVHSTVPSAITGVVGFSCLWSILELKEQTQRVAKGWFPANPNRISRASGADSEEETAG